MIKSLIARRLKSHHDNIILAEKKKAHEEKIRNNSRHVCYILDSSDSMFMFNMFDIRNNININKYFQDIRKEIYDGKEVQYCDWNDNEIIGDKTLGNIINDMRHITKCMVNTSRMLSFFMKVNNNLTNKYVSSFITFSEEMNIRVRFEDLSTVKSYIDSIDNNVFRQRSNKTHIYDALHNSIDYVVREGNLSMTTFVLFTDGTDTGSKIKLHDLLKYIKDMKHINLIILTLNLNSQEVKQLKEIISVAKYGKLLLIGSDLSSCNFNNISDAFSSTKDIIVSGNYIEEFNVKDVFDLY